MSDEIGLGLWKNVEKTDKKITKEVGYGGYKYTAIDAYHQFKAATEQFGPYGIGWGVRNESFEEFTAGLLIYRADFWYKYDGQEGTFPISAGRCLYKTVTKGDKKAEVLDNECFKSIRTDALTKALSMIGFNADVFMGTFDGRIDDSEPTTSRQKAPTGKTTTSTTQSAPDGWDGTKKEILFGKKHKGKMFSEAPESYLQWVIDESTLWDSTKDDCRKELASRQAPELPVDKGGNIDEPMSEIEHAELRDLFNQYGQVDMWWSQFRTTYPKATNITVHGRFKSVLEGGLEMGAEWSQVEGSLKKVITELGIDDELPF